MYQASGRAGKSWVGRLGEHRAKESSAGFANWGGKSRNYFVRSKKNMRGCFWWCASSWTKRTMKVLQGLCSYFSLKPTSTDVSWMSKRKAWQQINRKEVSSFALCEPHVWKVRNAPRSTLRCFLSLRRASLPSTWRLGDSWLNRLVQAKTNRLHCSRETSLSSPSVRNVNYESSTFRATGTSTLCRLFFFISRRRRHCNLSTRVQAPVCQKNWPRTQLEHWNWPGQVLHALCAAASPSNCLHLQLSPPVRQFGTQTVLSHVNCAKKRIAASQHILHLARV